MAEKTKQKPLSKSAAKAAPEKKAAKPKAAKVAKPAKPAKAVKEPKDAKANKVAKIVKAAAKPKAPPRKKPAAPVAPVEVAPPVLAPMAVPAAPRFVKPNWQKRSAPVFGSGFTGSFGVSAPPVPGSRPAHAVVPQVAPPAATAPLPVVPAPRPPEARKQFSQQLSQQPKPPQTFKQQQQQPKKQPVPASEPQQMSRQQQAAAPAKVSPPPAPPEVLEEFTGILEFGRKEKSEGRLRQLDGTYIADALDPVVGTHLIEKYNLRPGLKLKVTLGRPFGGGGPPQHNHGHQGQWGKKEKFKGGGRDGLRIDPQARRVHGIVSVEGLPPETWANGRNFDQLTIVMPEPRLALEYPGCPPACRFIDLFCPIGKGTRGMIVSPPKAGKTTLLQQIATALHKNHPDIEVFALLVDERPEEVTDFRRNVPVTVWASSNDHPPEKHVGLAIAAIERCKRLAEMGKDVVVLLDSLTRLGRAFNVAPNIIGTGKTLSGGLDAGALGVPKQLFGAARRFEEGGSLTIIATALVDTGSRGDQVIFEEFKGTGNMELILDRRIAEQRLFPAMDLAASGTRNDQKLMSKHELDTVTALRRRLLNMPPPQQMEQLLKAVDRYKTNADLVGDPNSVAKA